MSDPLPDMPAPVAAALARLKEELTRAAGNNLAGLILYGGLARGRYRPGKSDVNLLVLLHDVSAPALAAVASALRAAQRAVGVEPMLLTPAEVRPAAVIFPTKFLDIKDYHVVLHGEDPFAGLEIPREQVRLRIVQQLRNLTLRLRRRYLTVHGDPDLEAATLANLARPLAIELAALLRLASRPVPREDRTAGIFQAAAVAFGLDATALARLDGIRHGERSREDAGPLFAQVLADLTRVTDKADSLTESHP
jgi:hypothetical protein